MLVAEMCDWWSNNWGWFYPLENTIEYVKKEKPIDRIWLVCLLRIKKRCTEDFLGFMLSSTSIKQEQREKYLRKKFG